MDSHEKTNFDLGTLWLLELQIVCMSFKGRFCTNCTANVNNCKVILPFSPMNARCCSRIEAEVVSMISQPYTDKLSSILHCNDFNCVLPHCLVCWSSP